MFPLESFMVGTLLLTVICLPTLLDVKGMQKWQNFTVSFCQVYHPEFVAIQKNLKGTDIDLLTGLNLWRGFDFCFL